MKCPYKKYKVIIQTLHGAEVLALNRKDAEQIVEDNLSEFLIEALVEDCNIINSYNMEEQTLKESNKQIRSVLEN